VESPRSFVFGLAAVAFCVAGGLAVLFLVFGGELEGASWKLLTTTVLLGLYGLLALPGARLLDQDRGSILGWSAVLLAVAGLLWSFRIVWAGLDDSDGSWRLLVTLTACGVAVTQVCATSARRHETDPPLVDRLWAGSNLLAYSLAGLVTLGCWNAVGAGSFFWRAVLALAAVDVVTVVLQPLLRNRARVA
jgi:hypothetical protein